MPEGVSLNLPDPEWYHAVEDRVPGRYYIEDHLPQTAEHHAALGSLIDAFDRIEYSLHDIIARLMSTNHRNAQAVCINTGIRTNRSIINSLATLRLKDENIALLTGLMERVGSAASKRNKIVHGHWVIEVAVWENRGKVHYKTRIMREAYPQDYRMRKEIGKLRNQAERSVYTFNAKRLDAIAAEYLELFSDISQFIKDVISPDFPPVFESHDAF